MRRLLGAIFVLSSISTAFVFAQQNARLRVEVRSEDGPVRDADVVVNGVTHKTDAEGTTTLTLPVGRADIVVVKNGFAPASASAIWSRIRINR